MIEQYDAYLFDLDGVITPTLLLHRRAWREVFEPLFLAQRVAPYRESDYFESLDGRPRFAGVANLLATRGITKPDGVDTDLGVDTVRGIGNLKNQAFTEVLERDGIEPYPGSRELVDRLAAQGKPLAVVSSSRNAEPVLTAAGMRGRFAVVVDGLVAAAEGIPANPRPTRSCGRRNCSAPRPRAASCSRTPPLVRRRGAPVDSGLWSVWTGVRGVRRCSRRVRIWSWTISGS